MISLISPPKQGYIVRVILNRLKQQQRSTTEQIFNQRVLVEKHLEHQKVLLFVTSSTLRKRSIVSGMVMIFGESQKNTSTMSEISFEQQSKYDKISIVSSTI